jgi:hypothetical protein
LELERWIKNENAPDIEVGAASRHRAADRID